MTTAVPASQTAQVLILNWIELGLDVRASALALIDELEAQTKMCGEKSSLPDSNRNNMINAVAGSPPAPATAIHSPIKPKLATLFHQPNPAVPTPVEVMPRLNL